MKKILLIIGIITFLPVHAACSIDEGESICTISGSNSQGMPILQPQSSTGMNTSGNANNSANTLHPSGLNSPFPQIQSQGGINMQSSFSCQFGNCDNNKNNNFLKNQ